MKAEDERDLLASLQIAWVVKEVGAACPGFDDGATVDDDLRGAAGIRAMQLRRPDTIRSRELQRRGQRIGTAAQAMTARA